MAGGGRRISVRRSPIHGRGVFALRPIKKGQTVTCYRGALATHEEIELRSDGCEDGHTFLFTLNSHYVIDANRDGNCARWINHACQPNCEALLLESPRGDPRFDRIVIDSLRDIAPGEELTFDYHIDAAERITPRLLRLWACRCGSPRCRGTMLAPPPRRKVLPKAAARRNSRP